jgi:hypothetical protein
MKTIIYKFATLKPVKVTEENVCITSLKDDEDMMSYALWLEGGGEEFKDYSNSNNITPFSRDEIKALNNPNSYYNNDNNWK